MKAFAAVPEPTPPSGLLAEAALRPEGGFARSRRGATSHNAGLAAEDIAARDAARRGCAVLARRRRCAAGEIDLILRDGDAVVFMEVKRRSKPISEDPVTPAQWRRLENAALQYMLEAETGVAPLRFDLAIVGADGAVEVIKNARQ